MLFSFLYFDKQEEFTLNIRLLQHWLVCFYDLFSKLTIRKNLSINLGKKLFCV